MKKIILVLTILFLASNVIGVEPKTKNDCFGSPTALSAQPNENCYPKKPKISSNPKQIISSIAPMAPLGSARQWREIQSLWEKVPSKNKTSELTSRYFNLSRGFVFRHWGPYVVFKNKLKEIVFGNSKPVGRVFDAKKMEWVK